MVRKMTAHPSQLKLRFCGLRKVPADNTYYENAFLQECVQSPPSTTSCHACMTHYLWNGNMFSKSNNPFCSLDAKQLCKNRPVLPFVIVKELGFRKLEACTSHAVWLYSSVTYPSFLLRLWSSSKQNTFTLLVVLPCLARLCSYS